MFRLLPKIPLPHLLRSEPEQIDQGFLEQKLERGARNRVRTLAEKAGIDRDVSDRIAEAYTAAFETARIEVSHPNQVAGLRRLVLVGPAYHQASPAETFSLSLTFSPLTLIGVTGDGLLFRRGLYTENGAPSAREGLRLARHEPHRLLPGVPPAELELNRNHGNAINQVISATDEVLRRTSDVLTREERDALPYRFIAGIEHVTRTQIARRVALARYALNDALDPDLLRLMRGCALQSLSEAEWICGAVTPDAGKPGPGRWFGVRVEALNDRALSTARVQAVRSYPALAKVFCRTRELRKAIDAREPLAPVIAEHLGVDEPGVRLLNRVTWQRAAVSPSRPEGGLARLASVPRDLAPTRRSEHRQLALISGFSFLLGESFPDTLRRFAKGGSPYRFGEELKRVAPSDVQDAAEYIVDKLLLPVRLHALRRLHEASGNTYRIAGEPVTHEPTHLSHRGDVIQGFLRQMGVRDMFDFSDRWHRSLERHEDRLVKLHLETRWSPFLGQADLGAGILGRELGSAEALRRQGRREKHCVGGYTERILQAGPKKIPLIFSIERDGEILGTTEVSLRRCDPKQGQKPDHAPWEAVVVQNRSSHNGSVCRAAIEAADMLCRRLEAEAADRTTGYLDGLRKVRQKRSRHDMLSPHLRAAGYDIWEPGRLEEAWDELSGYLPRRVRKAGLEALIAAEVDGLRHDHLSQSSSSEKMPSRTKAVEWFFWERDAEAIARTRLDEPEPELIQDERLEAVEDEWIPF